MKRFWALVLALVCAVCLVPPVGAENTAAEELTSSTAITGTGFASFGFLKDGDSSAYKTSDGKATLTFQNEKGIGGIYLMFNLEYGPYTVVNNDTGATATAGKDGILHEFLDMRKLFGASAKSVSVQFEGKSVTLSEARTFTEGETPESVQRWNPPAEKADLMLFATHGDDDQLFFAGLLPKYAARKDCVVQVVYLTDHRNLTKARVHEMLNGLWNVGIRCYPVFGAFEDFRIDDLEGSYQQYESLGHKREELQGFVVEQIRRFRPKVAVGHDLKGEYGHGMHMVYADLLTKALDLTGNAEEFPESAQKYGTWEIQKTYLHLYTENQIVIDYDTPMEELGGMTPFEVTQKKGYPCHESQQWTWFTGWINGKDSPITKASQIATYNPCQFGLYRTTVGQDVAKDDFLENIETHAQEAARLQQEQQAATQPEESQPVEAQAPAQTVPTQGSDKAPSQTVKKSLKTALILLAVLVAAFFLALLGLRAQNIRRHKARMAAKRRKRRQPGNGRR